jgi:hypothetical protein
MGSGRQRQDLHPAAAGIFYGSISSNNMNLTHGLPAFLRGRLLRT